jgi:hypothetical protein
VHRHRLAADHRFVDVALAIDHLAIHRDAFARAHVDDVTAGDLFQRQLDHAAVAAYAGGLGLQRQQTLDGLGGTSLGLGLEHAAEQDQGDDHRRCFVVDVDRAGRQQAWRERGHQREPVGCQRAHRDQRVHVRGGAQQRRDALLVEATARQHQHQRGQHELQQPAVLRAQRAGDEVVEGRHQVPAHFQREHRQGQHRGQQQVALEHAQFIGMPLCLGILAGTGRVDAAGGVAGPGDGGDQRTGVQRRITLHAGAFGGQVDAGRLHARHRLQRALHAAHARSAGHAFDHQFHRRRGAHLVAHLAHRLHQHLALDAAIGLHAGAFGGQVDAGLPHAGHRLERALYPAHAGSAGHAFDHQVLVAGLAGICRGHRRVSMGGRLHLKGSHDGKVKQPEGRANRRHSWADGA